jgi:hypothetical protein
MLPSPPGAHPSLAPLSPPAIDIEPSPSYSPLSSPAQSPKPPPSPPLAPISNIPMNRGKEWEREREIRELREKVKALQHERENEIKQKKDAEVAAAEAETTMSSGFPDTSGLSADALALRSALRLLILQRDRAKRDILDLEQMRAAALTEPVQFVEYIQSQKRGHQLCKKSSWNSSIDGGKKPNIFEGREIPKPQEIYRCPPIEWSQYKILGTPLDKLHEHQKRNIHVSPSRAGIVGGASSSPAGVPSSMQTGGIIGMPAAEYVDDHARIMRGRMRLFDGIGQRGGGVVGR